MNKVQWGKNPEIQLPGARLSYIEHEALESSLNPCSFNPTPGEKMRLEKEGTFEM